MMCHSCSLGLDEHRHKFVAVTTSTSMAASRKRRVGSALNGADAASNGFDVYNVQGDAMAALAIFRAQQTDSFASKYNEAILTHLTGGSVENAASAETGVEQLTRQLNKLETDFFDEQYQNHNGNLSSRKRRRNELIVSYNRALILHAQGKSDKAAEVCKSKMADFLASNVAPPEDLLHVTSRMALLLLECILAKGIEEDAEPIFNWLDKIDSEKDAQLKFLLNLYRTRFNLSEIDESSGKHSDNKIRAARKELKQAMDLLQNKLRTSFGGETGSVVSSANSEENNSTQSPIVRDPSQTHHELQIPQGYIVLQRHNQSALSLKAHSEQLKGNAKKSLILCSEALAATASDAAYEATHANNLAIVYETNGKRHLALHALSKGLEASRKQQTDATGTAVTPGSAYFYPDGTARPDHTLVLMHNAAICALQARRYQTAYETMAICLTQSPVFGKQFRSWLSLAEACIGLYVSGIQSDDKSQDKYFKALMVNDEPRGVIVDNDLFTDHPEIVDETAVSKLGSPEDLAQLARNPLIRARATLKQVLASDSAALGEDGVASVLLMLAYVELAFRNYDIVIVLCKKVLDSNPAPNSKDALVRAYKRRAASARMYAAEASIEMGHVMNAMKYLVGDGKEDAFDRLASDLGGVSLEMAASDGNDKLLLGRAQSMVKASASSITASLGNLSAAKQLAMSAQAVEGLNVSSRERSSARRALVYVLLKSGHHGPALALLRSLR
ncbi:hypothetical protein MPSEU_000950200 [Mayamaea pseudoterrestris]|nr:hypothetical protein MPSEU_000950200 [Mayamaea pseudoterrestris]